MEVKPESCSRLVALIEDLKRAEDKGSDPRTANFFRLHNQIPTLHFLSMSVFPAAEFDPMFIIEANFDGPPGPFWRQIDAVAGERIRAMIRCCKRPRDDTGALYDAVTEPGSKVAVARYLEARTEQPSVFHHGNRGLSRDRILEDHQLFLAVRAEIDRPTGGRPSPYRTGTAAQAQTLLRAAMLPVFPWLDDPAPKRISLSERISDIFRLLRFIVVALVALTLPGLLLAAALRWQVYLSMLGITAIIIFALLFKHRAAIAGTEVINRGKVHLLSPVKLLLLLVGAALTIFLATLVVTPIILAIDAIGRFATPFDTAAIPIAAREAAYVAALGVVSVFVTLPLIVLILRYNEMRDSAQDRPPQDERMLREMIRREDWIAQNHMGSIVLIKPGILRSIIIRAGHYGLGLFLRVTATDGYLGSMRTVHFAHWAFLNNHSRLLFFSNFDHSWDSYLDDFIEKAHAGLTLAWGSGIGFPPTRLLVYDGASHGRQFKNWALASRTVSRLWYSAYPDLTVDQIERNHQIANGLRKRSMTEEEATAWHWLL
ncbi:hypothetical protein C7I55_11570 [Sphingomonas deserti]|uniref:Uncharacterized protein n=1 Tax=Allosphingosinicella deserti TaxID=2116704 RepID=A0A2P7QSG6_9SPHN|nr:hypothetical protein C7I55_11570 [Sphingomonas deserti]